MATYAKAALSHTSPSLVTADLSEAWLTSILDLRSLTMMACLALFPQEVSMEQRKKVSVITKLNQQ